ncbi:MAG: hypothetical protein HYY52_05195 [Candidatus Melainabacteria bacterium]|nr:hypothetical protein [Candidatus Melainabacteria bacterium]
MKNKLLVIILISFLISLKAFSFDLQSGAFSINAETKDINSISEVEKINELLDNLENKWNEHNIEKVLKCYSYDFINGDGLGLESVKNLTKELWEAYPDIKSKSQERTVRIYGEYATVDSTDLYQGTSSMTRQEVDSKGILKAVSVGELFLKKFGPTWKITSDKTVFEKVSIGYGIGSELIDENKIMLSTPEQVASGQQYTARLDFDLPNDIKPVAAISKEILVYPQVSAEDKFRLVTEPKLEKFLSANRRSKNELITATVGLTGGELKPKLLGLVFLTRRVNVIPVSDNTTDEISIIKTPASSSLTKSVDLLDIYPTEINDKKQDKTKDNEDNEDNEDKN